MKRSLEGKLVAYGEDAAIVIEKGNLGGIQVACKEFEGLEITSDKIKIAKGTICIIASRPPESPPRDWREAWR